MMKDGSSNALYKDDKSHDHIKRRRVWKSSAIANDFGTLLGDCAEEEHLQLHEQHSKDLAARATESEGQSQQLSSVTGTEA